ncbi:MAG: response regulator [Gemmataceae bacterium]|nr:response regulator [Gemmataceae bacterium]
MTTTRNAAVADDDRDTREFLQEAMQRQGWRVEAFTNGRSLVEACRRAMPEVVVTDIKMPDMDGLEALAAINAVQTIPMVVVSAHHDDGVLARLEEVPALGFLVKPFTEAQLKAAVSLAVTRFRTLLALKQESNELKQALADRKVVERGKGILMRLQHIDEDEAFRRLRATASAKNLKLAEAAKRLISAEEILSEFVGG